MKKNPKKQGNPGLASMARKGKKRYSRVVGNRPGYASYGMTDPKKVKHDNG